MGNAQTGGMWQTAGKNAVGISATLPEIQATMVLGSRETGIILDQAQCSCVEDIFLNASVIHFFLNRSLKTFERDRLRVAGCFYTSPIHFMYFLGLVQRQEINYEISICELQAHK